MDFKLISAILVIALTSCHRELNRTDGWDYNEPSPTGGFQKVSFSLQETPPGMILIEGGALEVLKSLGTDGVKNSSFYLSKCEETNGQYMEYLKFLKTYYSRATYRSALPDTTVWNELDATDRVKNHLVTHYLRNRAYKDYPVVGLSPNQIEKYAIWKTDRINEMILIQEGVLEENYEIIDSTDVFTTRGYLLEDPKKVDQINDLNPVQSQSTGTDFRRVRMEDGILLPRLRLPTEKEWKLAYRAIGDSNNRYLKTEKARKIKSDDFMFLSDVEHSAKKSDPPEIKINGLQKVYTPNANAYHLRGLNTNIAEYVADSISVSIVGGSFLELESENGAVYNEQISSRNDTGLYGFRLAMDCTMTDWITYHGLKKRYRYRSRQ